MSESKADRWSQEAEVGFIRKLGTFAASHGKTRADLLKGYIKAHPLRARWLGIDGDRVLDFAKRQLAEIEGVK